MLYRLDSVQQHPVLRETKKFMMLCSGKDISVGVTAHQL